MRILALDTSAEACSVAMRDGIGPCAHRFEKLERGHAERISEMVRDVAAEFGAVTDVLKGLDRIAVTTGPGSFTGVRVGIATARGLALGTAAKFVSVTTHELLAAQVGAGNVPCAVVVDARRSEIYASLFGADGGIIFGPEVTTADAFAAHVPAGCDIVGSAADEFARFVGKPASVQADVHPDARRLVELAALRAPDETPPAPLYLRRPDAKPQAGKTLQRQSGQRQSVR